MSAVRFAASLVLGLGCLLACGGSSSSPTPGTGSTGSGPVVADAGTGPASDAGSIVGAPDAGPGTTPATDAGTPATDAGTGGVPSADAGTGSGGGAADAGSTAPVQHALNIRVNGSGDVQGAGSGCRSACQEQVSDGQSVHLVAIADTDWKFDGWQGDCSGSGACDLTLHADASVTAAFSRPPPPPPDRCAGLMPASLPPPVVPNLTCNGDCLTGTSDDGAGNFALRWRTDASHGAMAWSVFQMENGQAVFKKILRASDQSFLKVFSEPSGFALDDSGFDGQSLHLYSSSGEARGQVGLNGATVASDPSGGFAALIRASGANGAIDYTFKRFDTTGAQVAPTSAVFSGSSYYQTRALGTTLSHDTLAFLEYTDANMDGFTGLWMGPDGKAMGSPFNVAAGGGSLQFLLDGSLLQHSGNVFTVWQDGATSPSPTPSWLASREQALWLYPIREGAGYAMGGTCAGVEVLAKDGTSCGCLAVPGLSANTSIGRDGSLIVPLGEAYNLYPLLFH